MRCMNDLRHGNYNKSEKQSPGTLQQNFQACKVIIINDRFINQHPEFHLVKTVLLPFSPVARLNFFSAFRLVVRGYQYD